MARIEVDLENLGQVSDGNHTFNELYNHRMMLFSVLCNLLSDVAWKARVSADGEYIEGMFMAGLTTPAGEFVYRFHEDCWDNFNVKELEKAPRYDTTDDFSILLTLIK